MPGQPFFPAEPPAAHLRLTFSAATSETELHTGIQRLSGAAAQLGVELPEPDAAAIGFGRH
jgi:DNA-binding transcriptional MocR family regulator